MAGVAQQGDGLEYIVGDHDVIRSLFKECQAAPLDERKLQSIDKLVVEVSKHASAEERTLYPLIQSVLKEDPLYYRMSTMDDQISKEVLDWLDTHRPTKPSDWKLYNETIDKLALIEHEHMSHEEEYVIDALRTVLTAEENHKLWHSFDNAKKTAPLKPHPRGPATTTAAKVLHPVAGMMDKTVQMVKEGMASATEATDKTKDAGSAGVQPTTPPK